MKYARRVLSLPLFAAFFAIGLPQACSKKTTENDPPPPPIDSAPAPVPPALVSAEPLANFADADVPGTPYERARDFYMSGQVWMARLTLEPKALGPDGTKSELYLLANICHDQADDGCVEKCASKLGVPLKKMKFDGGAPKVVADAPAEHREPDTDAARARDLFLKKKDKEARDILEPKVVDGKASKEEVRLLRAVCKDQGDRMCVALCDTKLK